MKKYLLLIFTILFSITLTSCDINSYEENSWYSDDKLKECLVEVDHRADENTELNIIRKIIQLKEYQTFEN